MSALPKTLGELRQHSGARSRPVKQEIRDNLVKKLQAIALGEDGRQRPDWAAAQALFGNRERRVPGESVLVSSVSSIPHGITLYETTI
jgi:hypothetical protein